jgi:exopolysaccharide biosynthesis polyprenyl glycosylphosphotransferase
VRPAVLIGSTPEARALREAAGARSSFEYLFVNAHDDRPGRPADGTAPDLRRAVLEEGVEEVILADPSLSTSELLHYLVRCAGLEVRFKVVPSLSEIIRVPGKVRLVAGVPLMDLFGDELPTTRDIGRRIFDIAAAGVGLALTLPLWPLVALGIRLSSPGHVLYRQERIGLHGRTFKLLKFRTMRADAEARTGPVLATLDDHRVTAVGRFLRVSRIDELPQFLNVLVGDMSLVGPRPERPHFVGQFLRSVPLYAERYRVRPGITGLAQVRGGYDTTARNKARYDLVYLRNRTLLLDLRILARTVAVVLRGHGAR